MKIYNTGHKRRHGTAKLNGIQKLLFLFIIFSLQFGTIQLVLTPTHYILIPSSPDSITGARSTYELKIEVDYFEGLLWPEVIEGFDFLVSYFENRGIQIEVDFNSTNNVVEGKGYVTNGEVMRTINRQYHDQPTNHIYFLIARTFDGRAGGAFPLWGAGIGLEMAGNYDIRFLIMHEFGHCIGIGLQDDVDEYNEIYSASGFMGYYHSNITEYNSDDWNASFAPDGAFGNQTWEQVRIWNRYSVIGEIYDDTSDVMGTVTGDIVENGPLIYLREIGGTNEYVDGINPIDGTYCFQAKPGNYTLQVQEECKLNRTIFVNVTEREIIYLENVNIEYVETVPIETPNSILLPLLIILSTVTIIVLAFTIRHRKSKGKI